MDTETISGAASTIASFLIILLLLAGAAFLARWMRRRGAGRLPSGNMPISILSSRALGAQASLVVAQVGGRCFLLGVSRAGIALVSRLDGGDE